MYLCFKIDVHRNDENAIGHIDVHPLQDLYIKCVGLAKPRAGN